jgi:hypothetical protein
MMPEIQVAKSPTPITGKYVGQFLLDGRVMFTVRRASEEAARRAITAVAGRLA